jgi:hypothetical protein
MNYSEATWCDLARLNDGRIILGYSTPTGGLKVVYAGTTSTLIDRDYQKWLLYLRIEHFGGHVIAVGQDHATGNCLYSVDGGTLTNLGPCHGVSCVEVASDREGFLVYAMRPTHYDVYRVNVFGTHEWIERHSANTSQGFLQCDNGVVITSDAGRALVPGLVLPATSGQYSAGQNPDDGPDRIRVADNAGRLSAVLAGYYQPPRIATTADTICVAAWGRNGVDLYQSPFDLIAWGNDAKPVIPPDIAWTTDLTKHIPDVLAYLEPAATARKDHGNGEFTLWLKKSDERHDWGEWWHGDKDYVGLLEDRSTAYRMVNIGGTLKPLPPEEIVVRNMKGENLGDPLTLPLASYTWTPGSLWMPRHFTGKWEGEIRTNYVWWRWETWKNLRVRITAEAGYGRFDGHEVFLKQTYRKPDGWECNYFGPEGWRKFEAFDEEGTLGAVSITPNGHQAGKGPFVEPRFPRTLPIYQSVTQEPKPNPVTEKPTLRGIPRDQFVRAAESIDDYLKANPRLGAADGILPEHGTLADKLDRVAAYLLSEWASFVQDAGPYPGDTPGWEARRNFGLSETFKVIERERGPKVEPQPGAGVKGQLRSAGRFFVNDAGYFYPRFASCLYGLADGRDPKPLLEQLASLGYNGVRVFAGELTGRSQSAESARRNLPGFLQLCLDLGLYVYVCPITDSASGRYDPYDHAEQVGRICAQFPNAIIDLVNEVGHGTQIRFSPSDLRRLYDRTRGGGFTGLIGYGADLELDELSVGDQTYPTAGGDLVDAHLRRNHSPGGISMPSYHEAARLTELGKVRDKYNVPAISGEPNRAEVKDRPDEFYYILGGLARGLNLGCVFHSAQSRDAGLLTGTELAAAQAFITASNAVTNHFGNEPLEFINGHWGESPITGVKWYDPPSGSQVWRAFTFHRGNQALLFLVGLPDPNNWRNGFDNFKNGWRQSGPATTGPGIALVPLER